jgi:riboflavin biosynthesis pyrimidine reductase
MLARLPVGSRVVHELRPNAEPADIPALYVAPERAGRDGRPWVAINMISSIDGATAIDGVSGGLGGPADREVFRALRAMADVVLVGAGTVKAERYRPAATPVAVVSRSVDLPWDWPLFKEPSTMVVTTIDSADVPVVAVRAGSGRVDLRGALGILGADHGAHRILCEGGPSLNGALLADDLVDEICLTVGALAVGGDAARIAVGPGVTRRFDLAHVLEAESMLLLRYVRSGD